MDILIRDQVKELRRMHKEVENTDSNWALTDMLKDAADRIETLADKLAAINMERSEQYYHTGWILCSKRLPDEPTEGMDDIDELDEYIVMIEGADIPTCLCYAGNGEWYRDGDFYSVTAWMPLPEPCNTDREVEE